MALPSRHIHTLKVIASISNSSSKGFQSSAVLEKLKPKNIKGKVSSHDWVTRQMNDPYVKLAKQDSYRCRSAYKLIEIDNKYNILKASSVVVDCGAAPGSWSQVAVRRIQLKQSSDKCQTSKVISVDLQQIEPIEGVTSFSNSDFTSPETQEKIHTALDGRHVDVVLSDMAPRASGNKDLDHDSICGLCLSVFEFASKVLDNGGHLVCKLWDGQDREKLVLIMKRMFRNVHIVKPKASRSDSAEMFLLGMNYHLKKKS